jgi:purine catabolism regulator
VSIDLWRPEAVPMYPTVSDTLALPAFAHCGTTVVAGLRGLARPVRWVHVSELADIGHLLHGGELVLTTGISLPDDAEGLTRYVRELDAAGAAGIVVELVRRWPEGLPDALVEAAEHRDLPLVTVSREVRFVAISEAVIATIVDQQVADLRAAEQVHEIFTALTVAGAPPEEVLAQVVRTTGRPVILENLAHELLAYDTGGADPRQLLDGWVERSRAVISDGRTCYDEKAGWLVTVVGARGTTWGRLVVPCDTPPRHLVVVVAERAASALAVHRLVARDRESLERQSHRTLLAALLAGDEPAALLAARAAALAVPLRHRALVGMAIRPAGLMTPPATHSLATAAVLRDLADAAAAAARRERLPALVGVTDDSQVRALLSLPAAADVPTALRCFAKRLHEAVALPAGSQGAAVTIAVGSTVAAPGDVGRSLNEAVHVAAAATGETPEGYHRMRDVRLRGLLHLLRNDDRLRAFAERELGPLLARDDQRGRLLATLRGYCEHAGNKSRAAAAAHVSRTAYYQQLARIEQILGVSLAEPESMLSLYVALLALDVTALT